MQVATIRRTLPLLLLVLFTSAQGCKSKPSSEGGPPAASTATNAPSSPGATADRGVPQADGGHRATLDAGDSGAAKAEGPLVPAKARATSFCAIFGTYPANAKASAEVGREKIAKTGVEGVTVRETSDFAELAWGQLIVVSVASTREEAVVRSAKGSLATKGMVRPCSELLGTFEVSKEPAEKNVSANSIGCPGWNPAKKRAVCITYDGSLQLGSEDTVTFLAGSGSAEEKDFTWLKTPALNFDTKVDPKTVSRLKAALTKGGYRSLSDYRVRELEPGDEALWAAPKFSIRYERRMRPGITIETGSWNSVSDRIVLDCGSSGSGSGSKTEKTVLFEGDMEGVDEQPLSLYWSAEHSVLLAKWRMHFGREGDNGGFLKAKLLDLSTVCVP